MPKTTTVNDGDYPKLCVKPSVRCRIEASRRSYNILRVIIVFIFHATPFTGLLALSSIKGPERKGSGFFYSAINWLFSPSRN